MFINYNKAEDISDTTKYEDHSTSARTLIAISQSGRSVQSEDVQNFLKARERGMAAGGCGVGEGDKEKMCYLIAKDINKPGCYAIKTTQGKHLVQLKRELNAIVAHKGVQLVTISRPTAYGEYAPYQFASSEDEFRKQVLAM